MSEFTPAPPEESPMTPPESDPVEAEAPVSQFNSKAKRVIALLFVSNILFAISAFFIWQSGSTRINALTSTLNSIREDEYDEEEDLYEEKPAPVIADHVVGNFTNEMKIPYTAYPELMQRHERELDHAGSPYFYNYDFYNAENTETLTILPHFRTVQQMKNFTCGICSIQMVLDYYGKMGDWNEESLTALVPEERDEDGILLHTGFCLDQLIEVFNQVGGFELETTYDFKDDNYWGVGPQLFYNYLKEGIPIIVGWIDRGGHWTVIIGYDDMGTPLQTYDDVFIMADSNDTTDHNADGYTVFNAQRFFSMYSFYSLRDLEECQADFSFIAAKPIGQ